MQEALSKCPEVNHGCLSASNSFIVTCMIYRSNVQAVAKLLADDVQERHHLLHLVLLAERELAWQISCQFRACSYTLPIEGRIKSNK